MIWIDVFVLPWYNWIIEHLIDKLTHLDFYRNLKFWCFVGQKKITVNLDLWHPVTVCTYNNFTIKNEKSLWTWKLSGQLINLYWNMTKFSDLQQTHQKHWVQFMTRTVKTVNTLEVHGVLLVGIIVLLDFSPNRKMLCPPVINCSIHVLTLLKEKHNFFQMYLVYLC